MYVCIVRRSCNLNLINYNTDRNVTQFDDELYTNSLIPYINLPTTKQPSTQKHLLIIYSIIKLSQTQLQEK